MIKRSASQAAQSTSIAQNPQTFAGFANQVGANAPTFDIVLNNLNVTWARTAVGVYKATGVFPDKKTLPGTTPETYTDPNGITITAVRENATTVTITTKNADGVLTDGLLIDRFIQISVFA